MGTRRPSPRDVVPTYSAKTSVVMIWCIFALMDLFLPVLKGVDSRSEKTNYKPRKYIFGIIYLIEYVYLGTYGRVPLKKLVLCFLFYLSLLIVNALIIALITRLCIFAFMSSILNR